MKTPASIHGHPIHAMAVTFPIGLLIFSFICDLIAVAAENPAPWTLVAFYTMVGGFIGALMVAIPGLIDFLSLKRPEVRKLAMTHMTINLVIVALYAANIWLRLDGRDGLPLLLSGAAIVLLGVSGWIGGEMVHVHRVGVVEGEDVDTPAPAPRRRPAIPS